MTPSTPVGSALGSGMAVKFLPSKRSASEGAPKGCPTAMQALEPAHDTALSTASPEWAGGGRALQRFPSKY